MSSIEAKLLDIIIPVYNKQEFLFDLTNSLATLCPKSVNVIFVDDGSTDQSLDTLESNRKDNFFIYSKENGGVSSARNYGLKLSKSKYIWFFDPDDQLGLDALNIINTIKNYNDDVLVFDYQSLNVSDNHVVNFKFDDYGVFDTAFFAKKYSYFTKNNNMSYLWNKFYRSDFIKNIYFDEGLTLSEDRCFNLSVFGKFGSVLIVNQSLYKYYVYGEGTLSSALTLKKIEDVYKTNVFNLHELCSKREYVKLHIMDQVIARAKFGAENLDLFYKKEHEKFKIHPFPFISKKDFLIYILINLNGLKGFLKLYNFCKKLNFKFP